ncbi:MULTISPECIES: NIPSNAP family protein [unclassified Rhizobium]|uniref:NIPSNAP family protein n=1 Tax=unclassified Rhizobium TaxID=2613769 RepID=UPI0037FA8247
MSIAGVICEVRYRIDKMAIDEFKAYAGTWMRLIERYGGTHHGYFISREAPAGAAMSFPKAGEDEAYDVAVALFSFPDDNAYLRYRDDVARDAEGIEANSRFGNSLPFISYQRVFLERLS